MATAPRFLQHSSLLQAARRAQGLFQHHDAITGTAKEFVVEDYENYLLKAMNNSQEVSRMSVQALLSQGKVETPVVFKPETVRPRFNQMPRKSVLVVKDSGTSVSVFNSQAQIRHQAVQVLVDWSLVVVMSASRKQLVVCQVRRNDN